ncbi:hypothetical protein COOONC_06096 [Cooperia oncophora]
MSLKYSYLGTNGGYGSYDNGDSSYYSRHRPHRRRHHHKKKKFRIETLEESEEFPEPPSATSESRGSTKGSTHDWEDEDMWEKKFVNAKSKAKEISEEFPEITSEERNPKMKV